MSCCYEWTWLLCPRQLLINTSYQLLLWSTWACWLWLVQLTATWIQNSKWPFGSKSGTKGFVRLLLLNWCHRPGSLINWSFIHRLLWVHESHRGLTGLLLSAGFACCCQSSEEALCLQCNCGIWQRYCLARLAFHTSGSVEWKTT